MNKTAEILSFENIEIVNKRVDNIYYQCKSMLLINDIIKDQSKIT